MMKYSLDPVEKAEKTKQLAKEEAKERGLTSAGPPKASKKRESKAKSRERMGKERSALLEKPAGKAIEQILSKNHHIPYGGHDETVILAGIGVCGRGWRHFRLEGPPARKPASDRP